MAAAVAVLCAPDPTAEAGPAALHADGASIVMQRPGTDLKKEHGPFAAVFTVLCRSVGH